MHALFRSLLLVQAFGALAPIQSCRTSGGGTVARFLCVIQPVGAPMELPEGSSDRGILMATSMCSSNC